MHSSRRPPPISTTSSRRRVPTSSQSQSQSTTTTTTLSSSSSTTRPPTPTIKGDGNIQVVVRCRGPTKSELLSNATIVAQVPSSRGTKITLIDPDPSIPSTSTLTTSSTSPTSSCSSNSRSWDFGSRSLPSSSSSSSSSPTSTTQSQKGNVYGPESTQSLLYDEVAKPILEQVLEGYNCTIFAYGQTGTGKTYTMEGDLSANGATFAENAGIVPRTLYYLFDHLGKESSSQEYTVRCSYVELYNEELRDLNARDENQGGATKSLRIYDEPPANKSSSNSNVTGGGGGGAGMVSGGAAGGGVTIQGLEETFIVDAEEGLEVLRRGSEKRQIASTNMNERSSRSHSIFTILVHLKDTSSTGSGGGVLKVGKLNLVDLAGSENVGRSGAVNGRAREAGKINSSLLALGRVITMLSENSSANGSGGGGNGVSGSNGDKSQPTKKSLHIPYRESKLTRLLQDSLGGNTKTTIIATISPTSYEETASTLSYALQATSIKNRPAEVNQRVGKDVHLGLVMSEMTRLKSDLKAARSENGYYVSKETLEELETERLNYKTSFKSHQKTITDLEILKSELSSTRDQLEQNVRALTKTKEGLRVTKEELEGTREDLSGVREELELTKRENEQLKYLTDAWEESRKGWKDDHESAWEDLEGLRMKLARKTVVEQANLAMLNDASSSIATRTSEISSQTELLRQAQSEFVWQIESKLDGFEKRQESLLQENRELVEEQMEGFAKCLEEIAEGEKGFRGDAREFREVVEETCRGLFEKIERRTNEVEREQRELANRLSEELQRHSLETSALLQALFEPIQAMHYECVARLEQDRQSLSSISLQDLEALSAENAFLKELVSTLESSFEAEQTRLADEEATILARVQAELSQASRRRQAAMSETYERIRGGVKQREGTMSLSFEGRAESLRNVADGNLLLEKRLVETVKASEANNDQGRKHLGSSLGLVQQLSSEQTISADAARLEQLDLLRNAASFVKQSSTNFQSSEVRHQKTSRRALLALAGQSGDSFAAWSLSSEGAFDDVHSTSQSTLRTVGDYANLAARSISNINICNDSLASELQADLQRRVQHDVPTGGTPKPKERPTDRLLPLVDLDASDRPTVLDTLLRARMAADIAARQFVTDEEQALESMDAILGEGGKGRGSLMARSPSIELVSLPPIGAPRGSSVAPVAGKGELRRSKVVLGERDSNVVPSRRGVNVKRDRVVKNGPHNQLPAADEILECLGQVNTEGIHEVVEVLFFGGIALDVYWDIWSSRISSMAKRTSLRAEFELPVDSTDQVLEFRLYVQEDTEYPDPTDQFKTDAFDRIKRAIQIFRHPLPSLPLKALMFKLGDPYADPRCISFPIDTGTFNGTFRHHASAPHPSLFILHCIKEIKSSTAEINIDRPRLEVRQSRNRRCAQARILRLLVQFLDMTGHSNLETSDAIWPVHFRHQSLLRNPQAAARGCLTLEMAREAAAWEAAVKGGQNDAEHVNHLQRQYVAAFQRVKHWISHTLQGHEPIPRSCFAGIQSLQNRHYTVFGS
ncbi:hypothetical protein JCM5353_006729 [Sporobolomyces roseus]